METHSVLAKVKAAAALRTDRMRWRLRIMSNRVGVMTGPMSNARTRSFSGQVVDSS